MPGSTAAVAGISAKVRSFDGQTAVPLVITELNGRPVSLFSKVSRSTSNPSSTQVDEGRSKKYLLVADLPPTMRLTHCPQTSVKK